MSAEPSITAIIACLTKARELILKGDFSKSQPRVELDDGRIAYTVLGAVSEAAGEENVVLYSFALEAIDRALPWGMREHIEVATAPLTHAHVCRILAAAANCCKKPYVWVEWSPRLWRSWLDSGAFDFTARQIAPNGLWHWSVCSRIETVEGSGYSETLQEAQDQAERLYEERTTIGVRR